MSNIYTRAHLPSHRRYVPVLVAVMHSFEAHPAYHYQSRPGLISGSYLIRTTKKNFLLIGTLLGILLLPPSKGWKITLLHCYQTSDFHVYLNWYLLSYVRLFFSPSLFSVHLLFDNCILCFFPGSKTTGSGIALPPLHNLRLDTGQ